MKDDLAIALAKIKRLRFINAELVEACRASIAEHSYSDEVGRLRALNAELVAALEAVIKANAQFRAELPSDWDGDPIDDACNRGRIALAKAGKVASNDE